MGIYGGRSCRCEPCIDGGAKGHSKNRSVGDLVHDVLNEGLTEVPPWPDAATLEAMHTDCMTIIDSSNRDDRLEALARLLPYTARGMDLASLLGMTAP